jgi:hypothetical protein
MCQNPIPFLPGPVSPPRRYLLFDLQVELLFQLLFQRTGQQAALYCQAA